MTVLLLLTILCILSIFTASYLRLWRNPPKIEVTLNIPIPSTFRLQLQSLASDIEVIPPVDEPIPEDILIYIDQESEEHARAARRKRVRALRADCGSWPGAFKLLQLEDN